MKLQHSNWIKRISSFPQPVVLFLVLSFITGCANLNCTPLEDILGGNTNLVNLSYKIAENLIERTLPPLMPSHPDMPILVTTFVDNNDLKQTSKFGRILQEHIASRLVQLGYTVREIKMASTLTIEPKSGETILTRDLSQLKGEHEAQAILVGTISRSARILYISARLINPTNNNILATDDYRLCMDDNILAMFGLRQRDDIDSPVKEPSRSWINTMSLHDRIVLIPGASRPIGRAIARRFGDQGATLILPVFDWPESISDMNTEFTANGYDYWCRPLDLRCEQEVALLAKTIRDRYGAVDYLINNIERGGMPIVHGNYDQPHNHEQWNLEFDTTLKAKWLLFQHIFPLMTSRKGGGVVNISSVAAMHGRSGPAAALFSDGYSAANKAIQIFTETWAKQAAPDVRVNELMLGLIMGRHGEGTRGWGVLTEEEKEELCGNILLGRTGSPEEVANAVYFLAVEATYFSGALLKMDGGIAYGNRVPPIPAGIL